MSLKDNGYNFWEDGQAVAMMIIIQKGDVLDGTSVETLYEPTEKEIAEAFKNAAIPVDKGIKIVRRMGKHHHTLLIDVEKFKAHLETLDD